MSSDKLYILRVTHKDGHIEIHEFKNKKKALSERDKFRKMDHIETAKMRLAPTE